MYRSDDGGETWTPIANAPTGYIAHHGVIDQASRSLYLTTSNTSGPYDGSDGEVWRYDLDSGAWTDITPQGRPVGGDFGFGGLTVDRSDPDTLMVVSQIQWWPDVLIFRSTDRGETWSAIWDYDYSNGGEFSSRYDQDISAVPWLRFGKEVGEPRMWAEPTPKARLDGIGPGNRPVQLRRTDVRHGSHHLSQRQPHRLGSGRRRDRYRARRPRDRGDRHSGSGGAHGRRGSRVGDARPRGLCPRGHRDRQRCVPGALLWRRHQRRCRRTRRRDRGASGHRRVRRAPRCRVARWGWHLGCVARGRRREWSGDGRRGRGGKRRRVVARGGRCPLQHGRRRHLGDGGRAARRRQDRSRPGGSACLLRLPRRRLLRLR
ncbi:hypothetical protein [Demequina litorisediminis]|uniref:hypothetical protein n=1 Tax=Demequina litorisediminis TaxID=1849022 RepID=UPI003D67E3A5